MELSDVEAVERMEAELDQFIEKRAREKAGANKVEELWKASERRHQEKRRKANREAWVDFHGHMHRLHLEIASEHAAKAARLIAEGGYDTDQGPEAA